MKIFDGFQLELTVEYSGLSRAEIKTLRDNGVIEPQRTKEGFKFSFSDILVLRLVRVLKANGIKTRNIAKAHEYLKDINPRKSLASYKLYIDDRSRSILYMGERPSNGLMVDTTRYGQLVAAGVLTILPVGTYLEEVRKNLVNLDNDLDSGMRSRKTISLQTFLRKYGS